MFIRLIKAVRYAIKGASRFCNIKEGEYFVYCYGDEESVKFEDFKAKVFVSRMFGETTLYVYKGKRFVAKGRDIFGRPWLAIAKPGQTKEEKEFFEISD